MACKVGFSRRKLYFNSARRQAKKEKVAFPGCAFGQEDRAFKLYLESKGEESPYPEPFEACLKCRHRAKDEESSERFFSLMHRGRKEKYSYRQGKLVPAWTQEVQE